MAEWQKWELCLKHVPLARKSREEIVGSTAGGGDSRYFVRNEIERIEWEAVKKGIDVPSHKPATYYKVYEFGAAVGASEGAESRWVRVESTNGVIHGHPISEARFRRYIRKAQERRRDDE